MKLSELVAYRNALNELSVYDIESSAHAQLAIILHLVNTQVVQVGDLSTDLKNDNQKIVDSFKQFGSTVERLKLEINKLIESTERHWFQESYRLYDEEMVYETTEYILNRRPIISDESLSILKGRLQLYSSWKHPGIVIRPGRETFVEEMVSHDPLYLLDQNYDLLDPAIQSFPVEYQRRLRPYVINERNGDSILQSVPDNQFGICFVYNFFNFRPLEVIRKYLEEIYQKLKPGGVLIMTFNDCDREKAVMLVESYFACYTPGGLIKELASTIGYKKEFFWHDNGPSSWLELRKPGDLESLRGGQTLAKVMRK